MSSRFTTEGDLSEKEYLKLRLMEAGFPHDEIPALLQQIIKTIEETRRACREVN